MRKFQLIKEAAVAALLFMLLSFLLNFLPFKFEFTKGIRQGLFGFDVYDLHFSNKHIANNKIDSRIILVQIAESRNKIAEQLETISKYEPKVVGVDAFFEEFDTADKLADLRLQALLGQHKNFVLASRNVKLDDSIKNFGNVFSVTGAGAGYANFTGYDDYVVIRSYYPFYEMIDAAAKDSLYEAFTTAIIRHYHPGLHSILKKRNNEDEIINYTANLQNYLTITEEELAEYDSTGQLNTVLKEKIILLGYFTKNEPMVLKDIHFTPLNEKVVGKSHPDMYGVVVHANILSMILDDNYATMLPQFLSYLIAYLVVFLILWYVLWLFKRKGHPNHGLLLLLQLAAIVVSLYLFLVLFDLTLIKVDLVPLVIGIVLSVEALGLYKMFALWLHRHKNIRYQTIFSKKAHS